MVDVAPSSTQGKFVSALNTIRSQVLSCSFGIPAPPTGEQLDTSAVNVVLVGAGGAETTVPYNASCTSGAGWHYNDPSAPTQIQLCPSACQEAQQDSGGKVTLAFGCKTVGGPTL